ncbi:MAG TPA: DUF2064 domain-containing protein [Solirubrobacteraceae bacterium]|jgi:glycosyltransferase A (GT-A) superfamily protein (DUF2064 family)|nr:DUF2064 domain-containing protein [Solirubrobacteraceae bacterium]
MPDVGTAPDQPHAVLIMARAPRRGEVRRALEPVIGQDGCLALQTALVTQAVEWARQTRPRSIHVAHDPPDSGPELRALVGEEVAMFPQNGDGISGRLADAVGRVFARGPGPLVIVWPDLPLLRTSHAEATLEDLKAGCDVVFGPVFDGGFYLIAIARPTPNLFGLPEQVWRSADAMGIALAAAREAGQEVGILRAERALHRPADVRAALADPTLPGPVARALGRR